MNRVYSVDDILGTFWKLDTDGPSGPADDNKPGIDGSPGATASGRPGMPRTASEWAVQEFFRQHALASIPENSTEAAAAATPSQQEEEQEQQVDQPQQQHSMLANHNSTHSSLAIHAVNHNADEVLRTHEVLRSNLAMACAMAATRVSAAAQTPAPSTSVARSTKPVNFGNLPPPTHFPEIAPFSRAQLSTANSDSTTSHAAMMFAASAQTSASQPPASLLMLGSQSPVGIPALPPRPGSIAAPSSTGHTGGSASAGGSGSETSDEDGEDDMKGGIKSDQQKNPEDIKRMRRMLSNRESARRSRRRKQAHLSDLELQVAQLRVENSTLLKRLSDIGQRYSDAIMDNRALRSDVEALRAQVKMAQELVKAAAAAGLRVPLDLSALDDAPASMPHLTSQQMQQTLSNKMARTPSMQRVASLEHLHKRNRSIGASEAST
eukprot:jgi/Chlat1/7319/Chrsp58S06923